jgi:hypothetical protein
MIMKTSIIFLYVLCLTTSGCSLVTVPVKAAGGIVTTSVKTTGKVVTAPFDAVGRSKDSKKEANEVPKPISPEQEQLRPVGTTQE